ncbi:MAG: bifunctional hydroxymethylpyrimidine kinase/phosphomethylpyrimidine kinase [Aquabacterium sp.]
MTPTDTPSSTTRGTPPVVWHIAGLDTAGGAGLSADQRAIEALGAHACPVAATLTAQNSQGVHSVHPVPAHTLEAQLAALADDLPPAAIKTGLLGSIEAIDCVARWVDRLRTAHRTGDAAQHALPLVVDPVLKASAGGAAFTDAALWRALREQLLPRATVLTPNRAEAHALVHGHWPAHTVPREAVPALARALCALGAEAVVITGGDSDDGRHCLDWLHTPHAQGWLAAPRVPTPHHHGTGCTFASGLAAAMALGHVSADAAVLANMLTRHALMHAHPAGTGAGPVKARAGFADGPAMGGAPLPWLGLHDALPWRITVGEGAGSPPLFRPFTPPADRLYGIVADGPQVRAALNAGLRCVQLRHKPQAGLEGHLGLALEAARHAGAPLFINDHWRAAVSALTSEAPPGPPTRLQLGVHLGQEDLLSLSEQDTATLLSHRHEVMLGLSSHSLWELARAAGCGASVIACGPLQPTTTKDMPWRPQGTHNLRWWVRHSPVPVLGIGGLLTADDLRRHGDCGAAALCVVRALGTSPEAMARQVPALRAALTTAAMPAAASHDASAGGLPHPVL